MCQGSHERTIECHSGVNCFGLSCSNNDMESSTVKIKSMVNFTL